METSTAKRSFRAAIGIAAAFVFITTTAFAAWQLLKPGDVADRFEEHALRAAFESEDAININESVTSGDYIFTLLGIVTGKNLTDHPVSINGEIREDRTYSVLAIRKADGSPMPDTRDEEYGNPSFYVSPYIKGLKPWQVNAHTMGGGYSEMVVDGVMYRLLDCDELAIFADRGVYLGIHIGSFPDSQVMIYDEVTGVITVNPDYDGAAIFDLPFDHALADPQKAEQYLHDVLGEFIEN